MLVAFIILAIIVAIAIVIFAVKASNIKNAIEDIYAKQSIIHDTYCNHEDRIDGNYKSLAELNRRQDDFEKVGKGRYAELSNDIKRLRDETMPEIKSLQDYNAEREKRAKEAVEDFKNTMNCIAEIAKKREKKDAKAKEKDQANDTPATSPRETRDAKQTAQANRERFAELRKTMSVSEAAKELGVSLTTAKRYEKARKANEGK